MSQELMTNIEYNMLIEDIKFIKEVEIPENIKNLEIAASYGDLRENAEYEAEINRQSFLSARLSELELLRNNVTIIDPKKREHDKIIFGSTFKIFNIDTEEESIYTLVGGYKADTSNNRISYKSPLAKMFINKKVGDEIETNFNNQKNIYEILEIYFDEECLK